MLTFTLYGYVCEGVKQYSENSLPNHMACFCVCVCLCTIEFAAL